MRTASGAPLPRATFVVTTGQGSLDRYAQKLAEHLEADTLATDAYTRAAELFNAPTLSWRSVRGFAADARFVGTLRALHGLVHLPNHHLARYGSFLSGPYVATVHDVIRYLDVALGTRLIHDPNGRDRIVLSLDRRGIRRAAAVVAVSETTKRDLVTHLGLPEERIFVVHEGIDHRVFRPVPRRLAPWPYVLFVGSEHPRKNLPALLRAFALLKRERRFADLRLVKVGVAGGREAPFRETTRDVVADLGLARDVVFTERVPESELAAWYSGASCLALPSLYEGFGFPPLEAMACGCPAVVSTAAALPEVSGAAALQVDPHDVRALADALRALIVDDGLRAELRARGLAHAARFTWERAARETEAVYRTVQEADGEARPFPSRTPATSPADAAAFTEVARPDAPGSGTFLDTRRR